MSNLKEFIEAHRQTGNTTNLLKLVTETRGYLVVPNKSIKDTILHNHPEFELPHLILTFKDIDDAKWKWGTKKFRTVFFDNSAVEALSSYNNIIADSEEPDSSISMMKVDSKNTCQPTRKDLDTWREVFEHARYDKDFSIMTHKEINVDTTNVKIDSGGITINTEHPLKLNVGDSHHVYTDSKKQQQINIKLEEADVNAIKSINQDFFEGEATNSMLGRILLRKGIYFYKKLREKF